jgi:hypothetical protein
MLGVGTFTQSDFLKNLWTAAKSATMRTTPWPIREGRPQINCLATCGLLIVSHRLAFCGGPGDRGSLNEGKPMTRLAEPRRSRVDQPITDGASLSAFGKARSTVSGEALSKVDLRKLRARLRARRRQTGGRRLEVAVLSRGGRGSRRAVGLI